MKLKAKMYDRAGKEMIPPICEICHEPMLCAIGKEWFQWLCPCKAIYKMDKKPEDGVDN